jgi:hypothetical protein
MNLCCWLWRKYLIPWTSSCQCWILTFRTTVDSCMSRSLTCCEKVARAPIRRTTVSVMWVTWIEHSKKWNSTFSDFKTYLKLGSSSTCPRPIYHIINIRHSLPLPCRLTPLILNEVSPALDSLLTYTTFTFCDISAAGHFGTYLSQLTACYMELQKLKEEFPKFTSDS